MLIAKLKMALNVVVAVQIVSKTGGLMVQMILGVCSFAIIAALPCTVAREIILTKRLSGIRAAWHF
ncbi:hypothetical protein KZY42_001157 [Vibrio vulnificus]|uniref:hypothetical protein n=1 Tax=Vibrio TaxID=662 RepID=UPI000932E459|nr:MULTISPECIES: hypothetical protein [Vibrio]MBE4575934.1 hypothetical protein [Vibrio navarrensis]EHT4943431.1 hypothetical protein [Vibrio vulnificus]EHU9443771.1 hypothetical protein [Vibrio vulnificus]MCU8524505.1 hypothetical protein [Vibrio vulnificus]MCU8530008.1 hypothetical protein [Vibrio vulnificus]